MGSATAGSSGVPGDPGALRGAAASFGGASGHLGALAGDLTGATPGAWDGPASVACAALLRVLAHDVRTGDAAFRMVAHALNGLADEIEAAQERAAAALQAAAVADSRADGLGQKALLEEAPAPDAMIGQLRDEAYGLRAIAVAERENARTAALVAAGVFAQAGGMAPQPPPPPPPPEHHDDGGGGFFSDAWSTIKSAPGAAKDAYDGANGWIDDRQEDMDGMVHSVTSHLPGPLQAAADHAYAWSPMSPKFSIDFAQGVGDWGVGMVEATPMLVKLTPQYGLIDPAGQATQQQQMVDGMKYAWDHPGDTVKAVTGWNHVENGEPGRMAGEAAPDVVLTILSGGAASAAKVTRTSHALVDAAKLADGAKDVSRLRAKGLIDYSGRYPNELENFGPGSVEHTLPTPGGRVVANAGDAARIPGERGRAIAWWTDAQQMHGYGDVQKLQDGLALPDDWGARNEVILADIPPGAEHVRMEGPSAPQLHWNDPRPGGDHQILYREFDARHVVARLPMDEFLRIHVPRFGPEDLWAPSVGAGGVIIPPHQP
jgi:hypothetical protein